MKAGESAEGEAGLVRGPLNVARMQVLLAVAEVAQLLVAVAKELSARPNLLSEIADDAAGTLGAGPDDDKVVKHRQEHDHGFSSRDCTR